MYCLKWLSFASFGYKHWKQHSSYFWNLKVGIWYCGLQVPLHNVESWKTSTFVHWKKFEVSLTITDIIWLSSETLNFKTTRKMDSISSQMSREHFFFFSLNHKLQPNLSFSLKDKICIFFKIFLIMCSNDDWFWQNSQMKMNKRKSKQVKKGLKYWPVRKNKTSYSEYYIIIISFIVYRYSNRSPKRITERRHPETCQ